MLSLCKDHPTILAFTGKTWCPHCKAIEPEMHKLHAEQGTDFHFMQIDTQDVASEPLLKEFQIVSYPTLLLFNPATSKFTLHGGARTADALSHCAKTGCEGTEWTTVPSYELVAHGPTTTPPSTLPPVRKLELCQNCPTVLAFTGVDWCPHCRVAQPTLDALKSQATTFHVQQFDTADSRDIINQFGIGEFPTILIYARGSFQRFDTSFLSELSEEVARGDKPLHPQTAWTNTPSAAQMDFVQCTFVSLQAGTYTMEPYTEEPCHQRHEEAQQLAFREQQVSLPHKAQEDMHDLEVCGSCRTIFAFTGTEWCPPCGAFEPELRRLDASQGCANKYHLLRYDHKLESKAQGNGKNICEMFDVAKFPTVLIFDPASRRFYVYQGVRQATAITRFSAQDATNQWPAPQGLRVAIRKNKTRVMEVSVQVRAQTNGRLHMCAACPTVLIFALRSDTYAHLIVHEDVDVNIHALHFNAKQHQVVMDLFDVHVFPTVLVYDPQRHVFFVYEGNCSDLANIKQAHVARGLKKTWNTHPQIVLLRDHEST